MSSAEVILLVVIVFGSTAFGYLSVLRMASRRESMMRQRFPDAEAIIPEANFFGQESKGVTQMRGNGTLVITSTEIYFEQWLPRREFIIPLEQIQKVETINTFLGKTVRRPLMKVMYLNDDGKPDSMAWLVPNVDSLKRMLDKRKG